MKNRRRKKGNQEPKVDKMTRDTIFKRMTAQYRRSATKKKEPGVGRELCRHGHHAHTCEGADAWWARTPRAWQVAPAAQDIVSVYTGGRDLERWRAQAGQFVLVRFWAPGFRWFAHPFSLSAAPDGSYIRLTIKALGDYTRRVAELQPGTPVLVEGPLGIFTADVCRARAAVLIAGGIGITPLRAVAQEFCKRGVPWTLLHSVTTPAAAALKDECENLARAHVGCAYHLVVSKDPTWHGERGHIDRDMLTRLVPDICQRDVYLCGPAAMMHALRRVALSCGVPRHAIHFERFAL